MQKKVFQLLVDNTAGVLSRISGLFSRRGYNIESITAGTTADPRFTRITIVASGNDDILEQIEKQLRKLTDVRSVKELVPDNSVYRELCMIKLEIAPEKMQNVISLVGVYHATIEDLTENSLMIV
ncbi:MAG: acetolactate synthase small subunit, partial [Lachnospiraceae bacterium]|nr:acetolactate synthase small subunit [Lachnospiraceae bacterium]